MSNTLKFGNGLWATKEGSTLAYNDENGNFKPLPFNFTRATSATRVNKDGLIEVVTNNKPRIDFSNDANGALLLEPQRTNNFQQSNQFDTTWQISAAGVSVTPNQVGVGNSQDAWKLTEGTFNGEHFIRQTPNIGGVVSISVYAKAGTNDFLYIRGVNSGLNRRTWFNLSTGTVGTNQGISAEMISMGNGWYRCVMVLDHQTAFEYYIAVSNADGVSSYQGSNNYIYIQNSQLEQGSYSTSYIPTNGSTVTVVADACNQTPPSGIIGQTEGTLFVDAANLFTSGTRTIALLYTNGSAFYQIYINASNEVRVDVNGSFLFLGGTIAANTQYKIAFAYKSGEYALYINGAQIATSVSTTMPSSLTEFYVGNSIGTEQSGAYNQAQLYNTRLSNAELQALTTI